VCRQRGRAPRGLRLVLTGGVPTPPALKRAWRDEFGICLAESYGQSELGGFIGLGFPDLPADRHLLASGPSLPDRVVRVVDRASGRPCGPGVVGEIAVAGGCMIGYRGKPGLTAQVVRDGWLHTGDLGHMDRDGHVFFRGRISELLLVDGQTWFPRDAEDAAYEHPDVLHAALIGARLETGGHRPVLFVALRAGDAARPGLTPMLAQHVARQLGPGAAVPEVRILDALPLTPTSKIDRMALRDGKLVATGEVVELPARTVCIGTSSSEVRVMIAKSRPAISCAAAMPASAAVRASRLSRNSSATSER
jgi:acyl-coenzyme A synthetase/AMP-(fatty) acid ligase